MKTKTKRYWLVTRRWYDVDNDSYITTSYEIYREIENSSKVKKVLDSRNHDISRSKIRKLVKVLNGDL